MDSVTLSVRIPEIQFHIREAIRKYQGDLDKMVDESVARALRSFDFNDYVAHNIDSELRAAVQKTVSGALARLMWDPAFSEAVQEEMRKSLLRKDPA